VGLWAFSCIRIIVSAFYALQDTKTPVRIAVVALIVNIIMSLLLMGPMKHGGLALATSISSAVNVAMLFVILKKKIGQFLEKDFFSSLYKITISSLVMGAVILAITYIMHWNNEGSFNERLVILAVSIIVGFAVFTGISYILKSEEIVVVFKTLKKKFAR
jgi:putative peptidoglycan lipid II flippase